MVSPWINIIMSAMIRHDDAYYGTKHMGMHHLIRDMNRCGSDVTDVMP